MKKEAGDIDTLHLDDNLFYLKSEADKEIDFWKKESHDHYERWFSLNRQYEGWLGKVMRCERAERELRNQKYKRCLYMAMWCEERHYYLTSLDRANYQLTDKEYQQTICGYWDRWHKRWLELAEKFKPTNTTAQQGKG